MNCRVRTGKLTVAAYNLGCSNCDASIANGGNGSFLWGVEGSEIEPDQTTVECFDCGAIVRLPAALLKMLRPLRQS